MNIKLLLSTFCLGLMLTKETTMAKLLNCSLYINKTLVKEATNYTEKYSFESYLHECFKANEYDVTQPPFPAGEQYQTMDMEYWYDLYQLIELDNAGRLTAIADLGISWYDFNRQWDLQEIPLEYITVPAQEVWFPDAKITNCIGGNCEFFAGYQTSITIYNYGYSFYYLERVEHQVACEMNLTYFPYDSQNCSIYFILSARLYNIPINLQALEEVNIFERFAHEEWELISMSDSVTEMMLFTYHRKNGTSAWEMKPSYKYAYRVSGFVVTLGFRRRFDYYEDTLIAPILLVSLIGVFVLLLPYSSNDKVSLEITILLGYLFLQSLIVTSIPQSETRPLIFKYIVGALIISAFNVITSSIFTCVRTYIQRVKFSKYLKLFAITIPGFILRPWQILLFLKAKRSSHMKINRMICEAEDNSIQMQSYSKRFGLFSVAKNSIENHSWRISNESNSSKTDHESLEQNLEKVTKTEDSSQLMGNIHALVILTSILYHLTIIIENLYPLWKIRFENQHF